MIWNDTIRVRYGIYLFLPFRTRLSRLVSEHTGTVPRYTVPCEHYIVVASSLCMIASKRSRTQIYESRRAREGRRYYSRSTVLEYGIRTSTVLDCL